MSRLLFEFLGGPQEVDPSGIASAEAFGTASINGALAIVGIASAEAFGTPQLNLQIDLTGIASSEAFGTPRIQLKIDLTGDGIPGAEAFGTPSIRITITTNGIASQEAFGTDDVAGPIVVSGIASQEAFGDTHVILTVSPSSIASAEAFGTAVVTPGNVNVFPFGIVSEEAFGRTVVATPQLSVFSAGHGDVLGGAPIDVLGAGFDVPSDDFAATSLSTLWTAVLAAGGALIPVPSLGPGKPGRIQLEVGPSVGSSAALRSSASYPNADVEFTLTNRLVRPMPGGPMVLGGVRFRVSAPTTLTLTLDTTGTLHVVSRFLGTTLVNLAFPVSQMNAALTLRVLRAGPRVLVFMNSTLIQDLRWVPDAATFEAFIENDATAGGSAVTMVSGFRWRPIVLLGTEPMQLLTAQNAQRVSGLAPPAANGTPGTVDLAVIGTGAAHVVPKAFTYELPTGLARVNDLIILNDRGLGGN